MTDIKDYIAKRAEQSRNRQKELEEKFGKILPLQCYNKIFVVATIDSLCNMFKTNEAAFHALVGLLKKTETMIADELFVQIESHGTYLTKLDDGTFGVEALTQSLYQEAEKIDGGFTSFIKGRIRC